MSEVQPIGMGLTSDFIASFCSKKSWASLTAKRVYILLATDLSNLEAGDVCFLKSTFKNQQLTAELRTFLHFRVIKEKKNASEGVTKQPEPAKNKSAAPL